MSEKRLSGWTFETAPDWPWKTQMLKPGDHFPNYGSLDSFLPPEKRHFGTHVVAGIGSGKSYFLGSVLLMDNLEKGVPTILFDTGDTTHYFFKSLLSKAENTKYAKRIVWAALPGLDFAVLPFPLYYKAEEDESAFTTSQRFPEVLQKIDPELSQAPVQGYNPLWQIATQAGRILITLGYQITEMQNLLSHTDLWEERFKKALEIDPSLQDAVDFFTIQYPKWSEMLKTSVYRKLTLFTADKTLRAVFGASSPGIDWQKVVDEKLVVLFDFGRVQSLELRRFLMLWIFQSLYEFIRFHSDKRTVPIAVIIDELSEMVNLGMDKGQGLESDLSSWINFLMRKYAVWLTVAHQEMYQFSEGIQALLLSMGTQVIGRVSNMDDSLQLAKSFFPIDPLKAKRTRYVIRPDVYIDEDGNPTQAVESTYMGPRIMPTSYGKDHIEEDPVEYTLPEQHYENAYKMTNLNPYWFFIRKAGVNEIGLYTTIHHYRANPVNEELYKEYHRHFLEWSIQDHYQRTEPILSEIQKRLVDTGKKEQKTKSDLKPKPKQEEQPPQKVKIIGKKLND